MTKDHFRAKQSKKNRSQEWKIIQEREDDQIAPKATAHSIQALQQWALATADIVQDGVRANETQMMERIGNRHKNAPSSPGHTDELDPSAEIAPSNSKLEIEALKKRKLHISSQNDPCNRQLYASNIADDNTGQAKRRRLMSPLASSTDTDEAYAQSSEWSFPSEDEVKTLERAKDTNKRILDG